MNTTWDGRPYTGEQFQTSGHWHCNECADRTFSNEGSAYMHAKRLGHNVGVYHEAHATKEVPR